MSDGLGDFGRCSVCGTSCIHCRRRASKIRYRRRGGSALCIGGSLSGNALSFLKGETEIDARDGGTYVIESSPNPLARLAAPDATHVARWRPRAHPTDA